MMANTYCFLKSNPTTEMLRRVLEKNNWQCSEKAILNDFIFDIPASIANTLEYKHILAEFIQKQGFDFSPKTFFINDDNYPGVIENLPKGIWILKPSMLNNGQHIHLFFDKTHLWQHYQTSKRMGGPHVIQSYIHPPHLLKGPEKGHKYSLRLFVVLTFPYAVFLYPHGYFNISLTPYDIENHYDLMGHLTNEHFHQNKRSVIQVPSFQYAIFDSFFPKIKNILERFFMRFAKEVDDSLKQKIAFLGVDMMLDQNENVYLLEINHGPCFPTDEHHPLQEKLYTDFWEACYQDIIPRLTQTDKKYLKYFYQLY